MRLRPILLVACLAAAASPALADRGVVPFGPFDVYEPGQKALIAWDGEVEVLVLSTDIVMPTLKEGEAVVLELIPLPSKPEVELGSLDAFYKLSRYLAREYRSSIEAVRGYGASVELLFHEKLGPHDVSVLEIGDAGEFKSWIRSFVEERGLPEPRRLEELELLVADYVERGYRYFVVDLVSVEGGRMYSITPIIYRFKSEKLYYPLRISSLASGSTTIQLVLLTREPLVIEDLEEAGFKVVMEGKIPRRVVEAASKQLAFMERDEYWVVVARFSGSISPATPDLEAGYGFSFKRYAPRIAFTAPLILAASLCTAVLLLERGRRGGGSLPAPAMLLSIAGLASLTPPVMLASMLASPAIPIGLALTSSAYASASIMALTAAYLLVKGRRSGGLLGWAGAALMTIAPLCCLALMVVKWLEPTPLTVLHLAAGAVAFIPSIASLILVGVKWDLLAR